MKRPEGTQRVRPDPHLKTFYPDFKTVQGSIQLALGAAVVLISTSSSLTSFGACAWPRSESYDGQNFLPRLSIAFVTKVQPYYWRENIAPEGSALDHLQHLVRHRLSCEFPRASRLRDYTGHLEQDHGLLTLRLQPYCQTLYQQQNPQR